MDKRENTSPTPSNKSSNSESSIKCRICFSTKPVDNLVTPCNCKGSIANVHLHCLEDWLTSTNRRRAYCEMCLYKYSVEKVPMYNLLGSLRAWLMINHTRSVIKRCLFQMFVLTLMHLFTVWCFVRAFKQHTTKLFFLIKIFYVVSIVIAIYCYFITIYLILQTLGHMWHRWWKSKYKIRLITKMNGTTTPKVNQISMPIHSVDFIETYV